MAALDSATRVFLAGNHISDEQRDKEQQSRRKAKEHERRDDEIWEIDLFTVSDAILVEGQTRLKLQ